MRVLHILEATGGGTRRHVLDLLPAMQARGVGCSLVFSPLRNPQFELDAALLQEKGVSTYPIPMGHSWQRSGDAQALRALHRHLNTHKYDLIHCHSSNAGLLGRLANSLRRPSSPLIYTPHYIAFAAGLPPLQRRSARWLEKLLAPRTDHFIAVSRHEYSVLQRTRLLRNRNATVIHNGVDASLFDVKDSNSDARTFTVGCFGRLTAQKNQQLLIRALPRLAKEVPTIRVRFVGGGEDESTLRRLAARLRVRALVEWRGDVTDVQREYSACDIVAQPSRWEGCSYALLEAMAMGKAVAASASGGNPEVLGEAGVLCSTHDINEWVEVLCALSENASRRRDLGMAARERVEQHFRLDAMLDRTCEVYEKVLRGRMVS